MLTVSRNQEQTITSVKVSCIFDISSHSDLFLTKFSAPRTLYFCLLFLTDDSHNSHSHYKIQRGKYKHRTFEQISKDSLFCSRDIFPAAFFRTDSVTYHTCRQRRQYCITNCKSKCHLIWILKVTHSSLWIISLPHCMVNAQLYKTYLLI